MNEMLDLHNVVFGDRSKNPHSDELTKSKPHLVSSIRLQSTEHRYEIGRTLCASIVKEPINLMHNEKRD